MWQDRKQWMDKLELVQEQVLLQGAEHEREAKERGLISNSALDVTISNRSASQQVPTNAEYRPNRRSSFGSFETSYWSAGSVGSSFDSRSNNLDEAVDESLVAFWDPSWEAASWGSGKMNEPKRFTNQERQDEPRMHLEPSKDAPREASALPFARQPSPNSTYTGSPNSGSENSSSLSPLLTSQF